MLAENVDGKDSDVCGDTGTVLPWSYPPNLFDLDMVLQIHMIGILNSEESSSVWQDPSTGKAYQTVSRAN